MNTKLALTLLSLCFFTATLTAQTTNTTEPRVTITKRTYSADGSISEETFVKKGEAAKTFNFDKYVAENKGDDVALDVRMEGGDEDRKMTINGKNVPAAKMGMISRDVREAVEEGVNWGNNQIRAITRDYENDNGRGYLGVTEDSDEESDEPGLVIEVIRNAAANRAGLRTNDLITAINDQPINNWDDLNKFMRKTRAGDKVKVAYQRKGVSNTVEITLGNSANNYNSDDDDESQSGFLGVSALDGMGDKDKKPGVAVSIIDRSAAEKAALKRGDIILQLDQTEINDFEDISDFMEDTRKGDTISVTYSRKGVSNTVDVVLGAEESWDWSNNNAWQNGNNVNVDMSVRKKDACLGVYTTSESLDETREGARITGFTNGSAARAAEFDNDDLITAINSDRVTNDDELWEAISKYKVGENVNVAYYRDGKALTKQVALRACEDETSNVTIYNIDDNGNNSGRQFQAWNWGQQDREQFRKRPAIPIRKGSGGDAPGVDLAPVKENKLELSGYKTTPNPATSIITVEFKAEAVPTEVGLFDASGHQLFREELNAFNGSYNQQFDLTEFAKGAVIVRVQQGQKVFVEQLTVN